MAELPKYFYFRVKSDVKSNGLNIQLEDASDADVVEVVRCKDCRWRTEADTAWHPCTDMLTQDNWFCCDGEAK